MANRKKLYFDFIMTLVPTTGKTLRFRATAGSVATANAARNNGNNTARGGDFLDSLNALQGSSPSRLKLLNETEVGIQVSQASRAGLPIKPVLISARFVDANGMNVMSYLTVGGSIATKAGQSSVFSRDFGVLLSFVAIGTSTSALATVRGVLVLQREHSMDI